MYACRVVVVLGIISILSSAGTGCKKPEGGPIGMEPDYMKQLPPGEVALRKITDPARIPDFSPAFYLISGLEQATDRSLNYMAKPSSQQFYPYDPGGEITHGRAVASLKLFRETLGEAHSPEQLNQLIRDRFEVWESVGWDNYGTVLYTGYYCPIFDARLRPDGEFRYPIYRQPEDLVKDSEGNCRGRRMPDGSITPKYFDRRQIIMSEALRGNELAYLRDPFEAYIITVQGSGKLRMADGRFMEVGYVANNGYDYVSIGKLLVRDGKIPPNELSLSKMIDFFNRFPNEVRYYTNQNPRYVFFAERGGGPYGSLNERVTPYRTIATDKAVYPRACVAFMQTRIPGYEGGQIVEKDYHAFALDQDTGGAIRAPGRTDVFLGTGDQIGELAGRTMSEGKLYYIFAKP
jgi:membrane-bound lytic murein transglycosylase A